MHLLSVSDYEQGRIAEGEVLFKEGDVLDHLYLLLDGEISCFSLNNDRVVPLQKITGPGVIGEDLILTKNQACYYSAVALNDSSYVKIPKNEVDLILEEGSDWLTNIIRNMSEKIQHTSNLLVEHNIVDSKLYADANFDSDEETFLKNALKQAD